MAVKPWRAAKEQSTQPNAFERIYNRKKFDVLGKKQKGERKHGKARSDAVTKVSKSGAGYSLMHAFDALSQSLMYAEEQHTVGGVQRDAKVQRLC